MIDDYLEALAQVKALLGKLNISNAPLKNFDDIKIFAQTAKKRRVGTLTEVINLV